MVDFGKTKRFSQYNSRPSPGCYATHNPKGLKWVKCRDAFQKHFTPDSDGIYFSHEPCFGDRDQGIHVANFISHTETVLGIKPSTFCRTNRNYAIWIELNEFWKECPIRRSLLTIFLRCALKYRLDVNNYDKTLFDHPYIKSTKPAVMRFLFGFTHFNDRPNGGWKRTFERLTEEEIKQLLIWPPGKSKETCLVGAGSLWQ